MKRFWILLSAVLLFSCAEEQPADHTGTVENTNETNTTEINNQDEELTLSVTFMETGDSARFMNKG